MIGTTALPATISTSLMEPPMDFSQLAPIQLAMLISVLLFIQVTAVIMDIYDLHIRHIILLGATPTQAAPAQLI